MRCSSPNLREIARARIGRATGGNFAAGLYQIPSEIFPANISSHEINKPQQPWAGVSALSATSKQPQQNSVSYEKKGGGRRSTDGSCTAAPSLLASGSRNMASVTYRRDAYWRAVNWGLPGHGSLAVLSRQTAIRQWHRDQVSEPPSP